MTFQLIYDAGTSVSKADTMNGSVVNFLRPANTALSPWSAADSLCITPVDTVYLICPATVRAQTVDSLTTHYGYRLFLETDGSTIVDALGRAMAIDPGSVPFRQFTQLFRGLTVAEPGNSPETTTYAVSARQIRALLSFVTQLTQRRMAIRGTNFAATVADGIIFTNNQPAQFAVAHGAAVNRGNPADHQFFVEWVTGHSTLQVEPLILPEATQLRMAISECTAALAAGTVYSRRLWVSIQQRPGADPTLPAADNVSTDPTAILNNRALISVECNKNQDEVLIGLLDPVTLARLVLISLDSTINKVFLDSFFFRVDAWGRIGISRAWMGISRAWMAEPKFCGIRPPSFPARRAMLFVHAVQSCLGLQVALVDSWKGQEIMIQSPSGPRLVQPTSEMFRVDDATSDDQKLPDDVIRRWVAARGVEDVEATVKRVKAIGYYGMFMDDSATFDTALVTGSIRFNTATAL